MAGDHNTEENTSPDAANSHARLSGDFYEEDEPIEDILAAWDRGEKFTTAPPEQA